MLLLQEGGGGLCRGRHDGGLTDPLVAWLVQTANKEPPVPEDLQGRHEGQVRSKVKAGGESAG